MADVWTIEDLEALEPYEYDFQEFKASAYLELDGMINAAFLPELSRQVSAFVNGAGGRLILGMEDDGRVDAGIATDLKRGGTRSWLEDVIPGSVDPPLRAFNVFEVRGPGARGRPLPGRAVYVIDLPPSDDAPHQALDHRFYARIAGKSRPMGNTAIQEIVGRTRRPRVTISTVTPYGAAEHMPDDPRGPLSLVCFRCFLRNEGPRLAQHVGAELMLPRQVVTEEVRHRMLEDGRTYVTHRPAEYTFFRYQGFPLFPRQEIFFTMFWLAVHRNNLAWLRAGGLALDWRVFADDTPPREGRVPLSDYAALGEAIAWTESRLGGQSGMSRG